MKYSVQYPIRLQCSCKQSIIAKAKQKEKAITIVFNNARQCNTEQKRQQIRYTCSSILKIIKIVYINKLLKSDIYQNKLILNLKKIYT